MKPDLVFICHKCGHNLYVPLTKIRKLPKFDCDECGEEAFENWTFSRFGDFDKEHGD